MEFFFIFRKVSASWTLVFIVLLVEEAVNQMKTLVPFTAKPSQKMRDLKNSSHIKKRTSQSSVAAHTEMRVMSVSFYILVYVYFKIFLLTF